MDRYSRAQTIIARCSKTITLSMISIEINLHENAASASWDIRSLRRLAAFETKFQGIDFVRKPRRRLLLMTQHANTYFLILIVQLWMLTNQWHLFLRSSSNLKHKRISSILSAGSGVGTTARSRRTLPQKAVSGLYRPI